MQPAPDDESGETTEDSEPRRGPPCNHPCALDDCNGHCKLSQGHSAMHLCENDHQLPW